MHRLSMTGRRLLVVAGLAAFIGCGSDDGGGPTEPGNAPTADFVGQPTGGQVPLSVAFTDQSTDGPTSWAWNFGDGGTSTQQNPTHVYNTAGDFTVSLTATNDDGSDTETKTDYVSATAAAGETPVLNRILPPGAGTGLTVTLYGDHFGDTRTRAGVVMFGNHAATTYPSWQDDEIEVEVPDIPMSGVLNLQVKVVVDGRESATVNFSRQEDGVTRLTDNESYDWQPCWSDNTTIYYSSNASGNYNIWRIDADGSDVTQRTFFTEGTTDMPAHDFPLLWYRSDKDGHWDIYESSGPGNELQLTHTPEKDFEIAAAPSLAPFQFAVALAEEHNGGTIWNIHGYGSTGFVPISDNGADFHPTWSGNGQRLAYMYKWGDWDPGQIMVVSVHGGASTLITDPEENCAYPTWNWVYDKIAYTRSGGGARNVFMRNPDGSDEVQLTFSNNNIVYPNWSPDGTRLVYASFFEGNYELYVIDVSGILTAP